MTTCRYRTVAHHFKAKRGDTPFTAQHATLRRARLRLGWPLLVFHGLLIRVSVRVRPPTRILIVPARETTVQMMGAAPPPTPPSFERLHLGDPGFEKRFHVLTAPLSPSAAEHVRHYLTPNFAGSPPRHRG